MSEEECRRCIYRYVKKEGFREESKAWHEETGQKRDAQEEKSGNFKTWAQVLPYSPMESAQDCDCFDL